VDLWVTTRASIFDPWGEPVNLGSVVNSPAFEVRATVSRDGLSLVFDSTRPGGHGGHDLWVSTRPASSDPWGIPVNMGSAINHTGIDYSPALSADGLLLLFASNRPGGSGEHDLWVMTRLTMDDPWGQPVNLGSAVNSPAGQSGPSLSVDGSMLYFGSRRPGGSGDSDLWQVKVAPVLGSFHTYDHAGALRR
jgi:Tol biopolymer transport system component